MSIQDDPMYGERLARAAAEIRSMAGLPEEWTDASVADVAAAALEAAGLPVLIEALERIEPDKLRSIAKMLSLMDTLMSKVKIGDEPGETYFRELKGSAMQDDLNAWADALAALKASEPTP